MDWKQLLAHITGSLDEELRLCNAYLAAENRILRNQIRGRVQLTDAERKTLAEIGKQLGRQVAYPLAADNVLRPLPCPLIGGNQPVMRTRHRFARPRPALLACNGTHLGRSTLRCSTPAGS
jgi:hypothetical protein